MAKTKTMTLEEWRVAEGLTYEALAQKLAIGTTTAFRMCCKGRLPDRDVMGRIRRLTRERVTPNDFYRDAA